jgi:hypothetical protein
LAQQEAAWLAEKAVLDEALADGGRTGAAIPLVVPPTAAASPSRTSQVSPQEIMARLLALKLGPAAHPRTTREALHHLDNLVACGPQALPVIRAQLARSEDVDLDVAGLGKAARALPLDFVVPPSLRFGLFDVVRQIGGPDAERLLAETMNATGRGVELAWLARVLQELSPNNYRDAAIAAARQLLARPPVAPSNSPLDRNDRDHLFSVLLMYGDSSYASTVQTQLVQADGQIDRSALKYLQQSLGPQAVPIASALYSDTRLASSDAKEPLARLALNFVGSDAHANQFYQSAINDMTLTPSHRKNLIEDLNQDGFTDKKNLTARDLPLIENRIALIEQLAPGATDPANVAAFKEAYKDLVNMRNRVLQPQPAAAP